MHSVSDLTTSARKTSGDVPPKLVGASTTVVGDKMYLFGGRLVTERRMVSDLYEFDLETFVWTRMPPHPEDDVPGARYFHSTDAWSNHLVVFGGMGHRPDASTADDLCVLNDVRFFDLARKRWLPPDPLFLAALAAAAAAQAQPVVRTAGDPIAASSSDAVLENALEPQSLNQQQHSHLSAVSPSTPADALHTLGSPPPPAYNNNSGSPQPQSQTPGQTQTQTQGHAFIPRARYAHLSSVTADRLVVVGGQDLNNVWLDDVCVFDLRARRWCSRRPYPRHAGTYRSVAVAAELRVRFPTEEAQARRGGGSGGGNGEMGLLGPPGGRYKVDKRPPSNAGRAEYTPSESLVHLPYSTEPTDDFPNDIYLYSNYNFTDVKRELEVFQPLPGAGCEFAMSDRSAHMTGQALPPGLRFPTGAICGTHLIFAGTYLAHSFQSYSIWALDLVSMAWSRLDPGAALASGSWFRAALWNSGGGSTGGGGSGGGSGGKTQTQTQMQGSSAKLLIFGNRLGNLVEDYNRRLLSWDDVAVVDLEAFGIYQAPRAALDIRAQELGLAALEEGVLADFELVCDDGRRIACARTVLERRWPWFREQRRLLLDAAARALEGAVVPRTEGDVPLPTDPTASILSSIPSSSSSRPPSPRPDPRLTPRALLLSEPYPITLALLQYLYAQALLTPLQHAPAVLSQLMLLSATYGLADLQARVRHAMHRALTPGTSVGVYEVATLCSCQSLQIRALKSVMASSRRAASGRNRGNSHSQGGGGGSGGGGGGSGGGGGNDGHHNNNNNNNGGGGNSARPRGMSDLRGLGMGMGGMGGGHNGTDGHHPSNGSRYMQGTGRALLLADPAATTNANLNLHAADAWQEWTAPFPPPPRAGGSTSAFASAGASASKTRSRIKHSVNLSLDSLYQALNSADEEYTDTDTDVDVDNSYYSGPGPVWDERERDSDAMRARIRVGSGTEAEETETETETETESDANNSPLVPSAAPVRRVGSNPALSTYSSSNSLNLAATATGAGGGAASGARPASPQNLPPGRLTRNYYVAQSTLLSPTSAASLQQQQQSSYLQVQQQQQQQPQHPQQQQQFPARLGIPRTRTSDSDLSGTASTTSTSTRSSSGLSPITPETPPLPTPVDPFGGAQAQFFLGNGKNGKQPHAHAHHQHHHAVAAAVALPLSAIEEAGPYDDDGSASRTHTPSGGGSHADFEMPRAAPLPPPDTAAWKERLRASSSSSSSIPASANANNVVNIANPPLSPLSAEPLSPAISVFTTASQRSADTVSESRHMSFTRAFFSRSPNKLRSAASSKASSSSTSIGAGAGAPLPSPSLLSVSSEDNAPSPTSPSASASMWSDARDVKKAAKAEAKRRKKEEERRRIEQLALQLKASAASTKPGGGASAKDGRSTLSGSSAERRRQANKWMEETDGLYGGALNTWGGL